MTIKTALGEYQDSFMPSSYGFMGIPKVQKVKKPRKSSPKIAIGKKVLIGPHEGVVIGKNDRSPNWWDVEVEYKGQKRILSADRKTISLI